MIEKYFRTEDEIVKLRSFVKDQIIEEGLKEDLSNVNDSFLLILYCTYEIMFFNSDFDDDPNYIQHITFNDRLRSSGARIFRRKRQIEFSTFRLFNTDFDKSNIEVNGVSVFDRLEALMLLMEHEILHFIEYHFYNDSSCRTKTWLYRAKNIFGHKVNYHCLEAGKERFKYCNNGVKKVV